MYDATDWTPPAADQRGGSRRLNRGEILRYPLVLPMGRRVVIGIVTGDIRRVRCARIWVNPENTDMLMPRPEECSISAIIRFEGARRDEFGSVTDDWVAEELHQRTRHRRPVAPGTAIVTGSGALEASHGVRHVIHTAAVHGEPGEGYRQVRDVGRCVTNALVEAERLSAADNTVDSILFPLLGCGMGAGEVPATVRALLGSALDHLDSRPDGGITTVYFLAYTEQELQALHEALAASPGAGREDCPGHPAHDPDGSSSTRPASRETVLRYATALSGSQALSTHAGRTEVIGLLPPALGEMVTRHSQPRLDLISLVRSCLTYPNGLASLLDIMAQIEGDSLAMRQLRAIPQHGSRQEFDELAAVDVPDVGTTETSR